MSGDFPDPADYGLDNELAQNLQTATLRLRMIVNLLEPGGTLEEAFKTIDRLSLDEAKFLLLTACALIRGLEWKQDRGE